MFLLVLLALLIVLASWATTSFPWLARRRRLAVVIVIFLWVPQPLAFWLIKHDHQSAGPRAIVELLTLPLAMAAFPIGVVRAVSWALGRLAKDTAAHGVGGMTRRQVVEATSGVAMLGATGSMLGWGIVRGRHAFELREVPVRIAGLPRALDGYVIAQVSDIHAGTYVGKRELNEGLARVREARPDLIVVTGDIVDFDAGLAPMVGRMLADLAPRDGVAAVLGNHEYYAGAY
jgi:uncharacterized protein